jgi:IPT/TIG domain/S-layer homology domain
MRTTLAALALLAAIASPLAADVTVNDAGDSSNACAATGTGTCTLRDAITYADAHPGGIIQFDIPGAGVHTIAPASALPAISAKMTIQGYSQPGASANTNGANEGSNAVILIELDGTSCGANGALVLGPGSDGSEIRGLAINRNFSACIHVTGGGTSIIAGNFIGTDPAGLVAHGCGEGILVEGNPVGDVLGGIAPPGTAAADRNLISGNAGDNVFWGFNGGGGSGHFVQGNLVGTDATGLAAISGATGNGITIAGNTSTSVFGGDVSGSGNVVSGNHINGIIVGGASGSVLVAGNLVGTDVAGMTALGNLQAGIQIGGTSAMVGDASGGGNVVCANGASGIQVYGNGNTVVGNSVGVGLAGIPLGNVSRGIEVFGTNDNTIGGITGGQGNEIAYNGQQGVAIFTFGSPISGNSVRGNSIHDNVGIGIDLGIDGPTPNDLGDGDDGANHLQNFPVVSGVAYGANTHVSGLLNSTPSTTFQLDFYANPPCSNFPHEFLQGALYLGSAEVTTDASGNALFHVDTLAASADGSRISVTATDPAGSTSEFSQRLPFSVASNAGPASGGTAITITGTNFLTGAVVTIGGAPATNVAVASYSSITAQTPALTAGTANDIVVTNIDETIGTLVKGFVAEFLDVPISNTFYEFVNTLVSNAITAGVGGGLYGVDDDTLRQQMAVFLLKARHGLCYTPPPCTGVFADVPCSSGFAPWIEAMASEGITGGCGGGNFCPQNPVRRDQMAVFLMKAEHGSGYVPPSCTGIFDDVPCPSQFANWIEELYNEHVTGGCSPGAYCPGNPNTRGQMAVFISKVFNLM